MGERASDSLRGEACVGGMERKRARGNMRMGAYVGERVWGSDLRGGACVGELASRSVRQGACVGEHAWGSVRSKS